MAGFLLAACALILLTTTTQTTVLRGNQLISQNWRPSYDIVVLPPQANIPSGAAVPADLLEGYNGGITVQQYEAIQRIPGVEVAAPIAFLGYAQLPVPAVEFTPQPLAPGYYRLDWTLTAFNGQQHLVERQKSTFYWTSSSCASVNDPSSPFAALKQQNVQIIGCGTDQVPADFPSIDTGTFLMAAIDPSAEDQLVHIGATVVNGRMLTGQDTTHPDPRFPQETITIGGQEVQVANDDVPLLFNRQLAGQIHLTGKLTRVASDALNPQQVLDNGGFTYLAGLAPQQTLFDGDVPLLQNDAARFSAATLTWDGQTWTPQPNAGTGQSIRFLYTPSGLTYRNASPPSGATEPAYSLVPSATQNPADILHALQLPTGIFEDFDFEQGPEVAFRALRPFQSASGQVLSNASTRYTAEPVGEFDGDSLSAQFSDALNWLPETTYAAPPTVIRYDAQGHPLTPSPLLPTTNPAGFLFQPPLALTTLKAAQQIKGDKVISVIRVRVNGVEGASDASWRRISIVAQQIQERTGLRALVTLGSSPQPTLVSVPGIAQGQDGSTRDIAPLGWVEERWISVGAALVYLDQLSGIRLLLLAVLLLVCLGYTTVTFSALSNAQHREMAILNALGWYPRQFSRVFLTQALALTIAGGLLGIGLALFVTRLVGLIPPMPIILATPAAMIGLGLISAFYPLRQLRRISPLDILRGNTPIALNGRRTRTAVSPVASGLWWHLPAVSTFAVRNIARMRTRTLIAIGSLFCSAFLLSVMTASIVTLRATLNGTLLGNEVLAQTAIPQLVGGAFAVVLSFLSVADLQLLHVRERRQEIGLLRAVGWRPQVVRHLFIQEGIVLALIGAVSGGIAAVGAIWIQQGTTKLIPASVVSTCSALLLIGVAAAATIPAVRAANRVHVMEALRSE